MGHARRFMRDAHVDTNGMQWNQLDYKPSEFYGDLSKLYFKLQNYLGISSKEGLVCLQKGCIPQVSTVNALLLLRSLENGWAAPDSNTGQLLGDAIRTILADRIDAATHVRKVPVVNDIGVHEHFEYFQKNRFERFVKMHFEAKIDGLIIAKHFVRN
ncbi:hypothetical protein NECAME_12978 [Necator americanus]|uniref:Uncharacterized protein n=1 Tax=Necator americanus TaxID=51031 RepID=W2SY41_NECAM|nr:hypothetical protein NECAME_12978 [Necator americanus]ETN74458.1 hypothetical protein NECAME_12978 [Necator americanus]